MNPNHNIAKQNEDFVNKQYLGTVVSVDDPIREGRCKIAVSGVFDGIPTDDLPWAFPKQKSAMFGKSGKSGSISIPKINSIVVVEFNNGDIYAPEFYNIQELADDIKDELRKAGEYEGSHFLLYDGDEGLKMWFTVNKGITIENKKSRINIAQDQSITIEHAQSQSIIELTGGTITINSDSQINMSAGTSIKESSEQVWIDGKQTRIGHSPLKEPAVLGNQLFALLKILAGGIDAKFPTTAGFFSNAVEIAKTATLSDTVTIGK